ncbi:MAG: glycosyltransferase, partial [Endomicrobiia bacterium]
KNKILTELGLQQNKLTILITVGLGAVERFLQIIEFLRIRKEDFQLIVVAGKYQKIYEELKNKNFIPPTVIIAWTDRMYDFIRVSDLVICKGGGAITSETLSAKRPIFIPVFVPGQERGNVYVIKKYKMGFYEEKLDNVFCILEEILSKNINLNEYINNIESYIKNNPAEKIVKFAYKLNGNL